MIHWRVNTTHHHRMHRHAALMHQILIVRFNLAFRASTRIDTLTKAINMAQRIDDDIYAAAPDVHVLTLKQYIDREHGGSQSAFAFANEMHKQQVGNNIKSGCFIVIDGVMYRKAREVK